MKEALIAAYYVQIQSLKAEQRAYTRVFGQDARSDRHLVLIHQIALLEKEYRDVWRDGTYVTQRKSNEKEGSKMAMAQARRLVSRLAGYVRAARMGPEAAIPQEAQGQGGQAGMLDMHRAIETQK